MVFQWAALLTFLTGVYLLYYVSEIPGAATLVSPRGNNGNDNVFECLVNYLAKPKKNYAGTQGEAEAGAKAALASRTNTLLSFPMLYFMIYSAHIILEMIHYCLVGWDLDGAHIHCG